MPRHDSPNLPDVPLARSLPEETPPDVWTRDELVQLVEDEIGDCFSADSAGEKVDFRARAEMLVRTIIASLAPSVEPTLPSPHLVVSIYADGSIVSENDVTEEEMTAAIARMEQFSGAHSVETAATSADDKRDAERYRALKKWHDAPGIPEFNLDEGADALIDAARLVQGEPR